MNLKCPQCNQVLPEVKTLRYRFCPHCGVEIDAEPKPLEDAFLTIPPDLPAPPVDAEPGESSPAPERTTPISGQFDDQTIEPQSIVPQNRPEIKPPAKPPPPGLFRTPPSEPELPPPLPKKQRVKKADLPPPKLRKKPATKNHQKVIILVLIILALVILILGGVFTF